MVKYITPIFRYKLLSMPYGIKTGTEVFQCSIEHLFTNQLCEIVVDDILVYGHNQDEHDKNLKESTRSRTPMELETQSTEVNFM